MTIDEAIQVDKELLQGLDLPLMLREADALNLSIEALQRHQSNEWGRPQDKRYRLPGETEEVK